MNTKTKYTPKHTVKFISLGRGCYEIQQDGERVGRPKN